MTQQQAAEVASPDAFRVRSVSAILDRSVPFEDGLKYMRVADHTQQAATVKA